MTTLLAYLKQRLLPLSLLILCSAIFAFVLSLYTLPWQGVAYAALLSLLPLCLAFLIDLYRFRQQHAELQTALKTIAFRENDLPETTNLIEQDYQQIVLELRRLLLAQESAHSASFQETMDYFTLWVHQIKTPISALRLILQNELPGDKEAQNQLFRIEQYSDMVLGFLRSESMSSDLLLQRCSLDEIIKPALRKFARLFIGQGISLDYQETGVQVLTDEKWLRFVLEQLLSNALKYTHRGSIRIALDEKQPRTLLICDSGIGIRPEDLPRVFERGFTGYNGRGERASSGIGLYLCKRILDRLSHAIRIESALGQGTCVYIDLSESKLRLQD